MIATALTSENPADAADSTSAALPMKSHHVSEQSASTEPILPLVSVVCPNNQNHQRDQSTTTITTADGDEDQKQQEREVNHHASLDSFSSERSMDPPGVHGDDSQLSQCREEPACEEDDSNGVEDIEHRQEIGDEVDEEENDGDEEEEGQEEEEEEEDEEDKYIPPILDGREITFKVGILDQFLICRLCHGYFVDATTIVECLHTFCKSCLYKHFMTSEANNRCPICQHELGPSPLDKVKADRTLQSLSYKVVPHLAEREKEIEKQFLDRYGPNAMVKRHIEPSVIGPRKLAKISPAISRTSSATSILGSPAKLDSNANASAGNGSNNNGTDHAASSVASNTNSHTATSNGSTPSASSSHSAASSAASNNTAARKTEAPADGSKPVDDLIAFVLELDTSFSNIQPLGLPTAASEEDMKSLEKPFIKTSARATVLHLKKFLMKKLNLKNPSDVDVLYRGEVLGPELSLEFVAKTRWIDRSQQFVLTYRPKVDYL